MVDEIIAGFVCLFLYRCACAWMGWHPMPLVTIWNLNGPGDDDAPADQ